jgi:hypothetical protein
MGSWGHTVWLGQGPGACGGWSRSLLGITHAFWLGSTRRSGERCGEQGVGLEEITQGQEGLDTQTWGRRSAHAAARQGIEHP